MGTDLITLTANDRVRLIADILRDVDCKILPCSRNEFARKAEKQHCCPEYIEFKKDYFLFDDKYARCIAIQKYPASIVDTIFKSIVELNQTMIITENLDFVEQAEAVKLLQRKNTDMKQEAIVKVRKSSEAAKGAFVDPIEGTQLQKDMEEAHKIAPEWIDSLRHAGVNTLVIYPLRSDNKTIGYIWAGNFPVEKTLMIKETLGVTAFILSAEIANEQNDRDCENDVSQLYYCSTELFHKTPRVPYREQI